MNKTARLVRNSQFAKRIQRVFIDIPMWGGSRGHKTGQRKSLGYEVLEASANSKDLVLNLKDIWTNLYQESGYCPQLYVRTVDLHNVSSVKKIMHKFEKIEFHNLIPAPVLSGTIHREIENRNLTPYVRKYIASDAGAIERTETIAMEDIKSVAPGEFIDIVYISKKRQSAGVVGDAKVTKVIRWIKNADGTVIKKKLKPNADELDDCVIIQIDDMLDTGGTICKDGKLLDKRYPHKQQRWFVGTHPVLSKGSKVLADTGVNLFIFGNTLHYENGIPGSEPLKVDLSEVLALPILRLISNGHMI